MNLSFRPITEADVPWLLYLYGTTREAELARTDFTGEEKDDFIRQQFNAQHRTYQANYPRASFDLVLVEEALVGRIYVDRRPTDIRLLDISLLPEWQNQGLGGRLMHSLVEEGRRSRKTVSFHVEKNNPGAFRFYERLGFLPAREVGQHIFMSWPADAPPPPS